MVKFDNIRGEGYAGLGKKGKRRLMDSNKRIEPGKSVAKRVGDLGEEFAARYLLLYGYRIVEQKYRKRFAEIDIIASKEGRLHFIEVKTRASARYGRPAEAVDRAKLEKIRLAAESYQQEKGLTDPFVSIDVFEVTIHHIRGLDLCKRRY